MCDISALEFFIEYAEIDDFRDKRILEVGSRYVNGSVRPLIERFCTPTEYIGIDIEPGKYVDRVVSIEEILDHFGPESFDTLISTESIEHFKDWRLAINNMKRVLRLHGRIYLTTRSKGFPYHAFPFDFWRYEKEDLEEIFCDFEIFNLNTDDLNYGTFLRAAKPNSWNPIDLSNRDLYSIIIGKRTREIKDISDMPLARRVKTRILYKAVSILRRRMKILYRTGMA
ncbi:methyltransferase type 11 [Candidatus Bathyarchaeota archaeon RBG_13_38_9]|nr:MAG: methyltransferase type 11 [Candidatus Bathyarchaeota archaeon RBG_13_38_9]